MKIMTCTHKFFGHPSHLGDEQGLLPNWNVRTLIVGTFNPENIWHPANKASYYYGRTKNYLWKALPRFANLPPILHNNVEEQLEFLNEHSIGITDLLIRINDAEIDNLEHVRRIRTVLDDQIELFSDFTWNTPHIVDYLQTNNIEAIYFTKLGTPGAVNVNPNSFEAQIRIIEALGVPTFRLHTPSGQGLGAGTPRINKLINRWYHDNGGNRLPFLNETFDISQFEYQ